MCCRIPVVPFVLCHARSRYYQSSCSRRSLARPIKWPRQNQVVRGSGPLIGLPGPFDAIIHPDLCLSTSAHVLVESCNPLGACTAQDKGTTAVARCVINHAGNHIETSTTTHNAMIILKQLALILVWARFYSRTNTWLRNAQRDTAEHRTPSHPAASALDELVHGLPQLSAGMRPSSDLPAGAGATRPSTTPIRAHTPGHQGLELRDLVQSEMSPVAELLGAVQLGECWCRVCPTLERAPGRRAWNACPECAPKLL